MSTPDKPYASGFAQWDAIKDRAKIVARERGVDGQGLVRQVVYSRLLARVFANADAPWVLKGGTATLIRVPNARTTKDVDLFATEGDIDAAVAQLRDMLSVDVGDHFRFVVTRLERNGGAGAQPNLHAVRVHIQAYCGVRPVNPLFGIDVVVGSLMTAEPDLVVDGVLEVRGLTPPTVRLYPVVDHIADKVCATMSTFGSGRSTRERDLIDLVVFACTQNIGGQALTLAIHAEWAHRDLPGQATFAPPLAWKRGYPALARKTSACSVTDWDEAVALVGALLGPACSRTAGQQRWLATDRAWRTGG